VIDVNVLNFTERTTAIYSLGLLSNGDVVSGSSDSEIKVWDSTVAIL
jgi:hypothetical protein